MKKNLFSFMLAICLLIPCALMLTGCDLFGGENSTSEYSITVNQNLHGTVHVNKTVAKENETITISTQADEGYSLYAITCDGVVLNSNTTTMPAHDIVISAIFQQIEENYRLTLGNYVQIAGDANLDGTYLQDNTFYNTITIKANNLIDVFINLGGELIEINDILYTQVGQTISVSVSTFNYTAQIIDSETILVKDGNCLHLFHYQPDKVINKGNYQTKYADSEYLYEIDLDFGDNTISITQTATDINTESSTSAVSRTLSGTYYIKGNTVFIETETRLIFAKISNVTTTSFVVRRVKQHDTKSASWDFTFDNSKYLAFTFNQSTSA